MPERPLPIRTPEASNPPRFKFAYVVHDGLESANQTWEMIKDCDIILQEEVCQTEDQRISMEKLIALATYKSDPSPLRQHFLSNRQKDWGYSILANAIETGKEFHYIDVSDDSPEIKMLRAAEILLKQSFTLLWSGSPMDGIQYLERSMEKFALSNRLRTQVVLIQIRQLREMRGKRWNGKRIGIVQGAAHEPAFETFKSVFPGYEAEKEVMKRISPILTGAMMEKERFPDRKIDQSVLIKIMFSDGVIQNFLGLIFPEKEPLTLNRLSDKIVSELTATELVQYWQTIVDSGGRKNFSTKIVWRVAGEIVEKHASK